LAMSTFFLRSSLLIVIGGVNEFATQTHSQENKNIQKTTTKNKNKHRYAKRR